MKNRGDVDIDEASIAENLPEQEILIQSVCETLVPKLVAEDIPLLFSLLNDVFPNVGYTRAEMKGEYCYNLRTMTCFLPRNVKCDITRVLMYNI